MKEVSVSDALSPVRRGMFRGWWKECYLIFFIPSLLVSSEGWDFHLLLMIVKPNFILWTHLYLFKGIHNQRTAAVTQAKYDITSLSTTRSLHVVLIMEFARLLRILAYRWTWDVFFSFMIPTDPIDLYWTQKPKHWRLLKVAVCGLIISRLYQWEKKCRNFISLIFRIYHF